jgi:AcrR family transcriptional regulator
MSPRQTNAQMSDATRKELLTKARSAFAEHGYAQAPIEELVRACGLTRGALYHHFGSKQGLFLAVVRQLDEELLARIAAASEAASDAAELDPAEQFLRACRAYLEVTLDPGVRRILLLDAPAVLATLEDRAAASAALDATIAPLRDGLAELAAHGVLREVDLEIAARMLGVALFEAATWVGDAAHPRKALDAAMRALTLMVGGLTQPAPGRPSKARGRVRP